MKILSIGIGFVSAALLCGRASASETYYDAGTKALPIQQAGGTARAMAMGSAVVGVSQGSASLLWNPAGLSRLSCAELGLHHNTGLGGAVQETAVLGLPLGEVEYGCGGSLGGLAASFGYVNYGRFNGMDIGGQPTRSYEIRDFSGSLGWGLELLPGLSGGISLKNNQAQFPGKIYSTYATDVGVLYAALPGLDLGVTYSNIGLGSSGGDIGSLASGLRLGAGWTVNKHLLLAASGELQNKAVTRMQFGTEYLIGNTENKKNVLALRAGYQANFPDPQLSGLTGVTFGLGYTLSRSAGVDYAMLPMGDLGDSHRLSLTIKFGCPKKRKPLFVSVLAPGPVRKFVPPGPTVAPAPKPVEIVPLEIVLEDSHFDFDSAALRPEGMAALRENVQRLKDNPDDVVSVAGYTSKRGTEDYNQKLSERRAIAVSNYLIEEGVSPDRITTIGYGEMRPAVYEASSANSEKHSSAAKANKRVVFTVNPEQE